MKYSGFKINLFKKVMETLRRLRIVADLSGYKKQTLKSQMRDRLFCLYRHNSFQAYFASKIIFISITELRYVALTVTYEYKERFPVSTHLSKKKKNNLSRQISSLHILSLLKSIECYI